MDKFIDWVADYAPPVLIVVAIIFLALYK